MEKAVRDILKDESLSPNKYLIPDFKILKERQILTLKEADELRHLRQIRNYLLHGIETPAEEYLKDSYQRLRAITSKVVDKVPTKSTKERLKKNSMDYRITAANTRLALCGVTCLHSSSVFQLGFSAWGQF